MCEVEIFLVKMKYKIEDVYKNNDLEVYFDDELIFTGTLKQFKKYINNQEEKHETNSSNPQTPFQGDSFPHSSH